MSDEEFQRLWSKLDRPFSGWFLEEKGDLLREASRSRAREKRLEGRLREMVNALRQGHTIYPGSYLATAARAALSEET